MTAQEIVEEHYCRKCISYRTHSPHGCPHAPLHCEDFAGFVELVSAAQIHTLEQVQEQEAHTVGTWVKERMAELNLAGS